MKITIARSLETLIAGKKGTTILTLKLKVQKMSGLAQKTKGFLCWIYHIIISLGGCCRDLWKNWTQQVYEQLVSLLSPLPLWIVRPPRNMCGDVEFHDLGWMKGVRCQDTCDAIKPTPSIVA